MAKHAAPYDYPYELGDGPDRMEVEDIADVLRAMPLVADELGNGSTSDWTLCILFALAGKGDTDALDYMAPRLEAAALMVLKDIGYPGPAFEGA
jgi:hypothetical protein